MGLFGLFKKNNNYFDKKIEPKCAYCEHGKPAKSEGKILCPRCGIVSEDYSCKKFTYSPFLRVPEKEHPAEESSLLDEFLEKYPADTAVEPTTTEINASEKATEAEQIIQEPLKESLPLPEIENSEVKTEIHEQLPKPSDENMKKEIPPQSEISSVSDIKFSPADNSENIKNLETIQKVDVAEIENRVSPKEIILPDMSESSVSSISNSPETRNSEEYLKNIPQQTVSTLENEPNVSHTIPEGTESAELSEMRNK